MANQDNVRSVMAATDLSEAASRSVEWAAEVAQQHGSRLILFHALMPPIPPAAAPEFVPLPPEVYAQQETAAREGIEAIADRWRKLGLAVDTEVRSGPAASTILEAATRWKADLLVAGTRGHTGFRRLLLGSTAARIVRGATCPVLTVHPSDAGEPRPTRAVLIPTDFSEDAELALDAATRLVGPAGGEARVVLLHAYHLPIEIAAPYPAPILEDADVIAKSAEEHLERSAKPLRKHGITVETIAKQGYPPEVILEVAERTKVDLIAMGTHGRSGWKRLFLGSTAERVLPSAPCPVLTVRRHET